MRKMLRLLRNHYKSFQLYYNNRGIILTIKRSIEVSIELFFYIFLNILNISDYLFEKYYFCTTGVLKKIKSNRNLKIGIFRLGGIGDIIESCALVNALKNKWPDADIYLFIKNARGNIFYNNIAQLSGVFNVSDTVQENIFLQTKLANTMTKKLIDIFYIDRYVTKVLYKNSKFLNEEKETDKLFDKYNLNFDVFPLFTNSLLLFGMNVYDLKSASSGLKISPGSLKFSIDLDALNICKNLPEYFFTIHHGSDIQMKLSNNIQTKNWFIDRWSAVVDYLNKKGIPVIQLGVPGDQYIKNATDVRGKTTLLETAAILKKSKLHLDTEGGLVHIAKIVNTKSLVLFGPTAIEFYGYKDNINLKAGNCHNCWWSKRNWQYECPKGYKIPECMNSITVDMAIKSIKDFLKSNHFNASKTAT